MRILITAGPTREFIDPIRYISNSSTGYFGYRIAGEAVKRGHSVVLISGPVSLEPPEGVKLVPVISALDMKRAVKKHFRKADCLIMTAAVADYRPERFTGYKIKKRKGTLSVRLRRNPDILSWAGKNKGKRTIIGFALETEHLINNALAKLKGKKADYIFAALMKRRNNPFGDTKIKVTCLKKGMRPETVFSTKGNIASFILDKADNG